MQFRLELSSPRVAFMDSLLINSQLRAFIFTRSDSNLKSVESFRCVAFPNLNNSKRSSVDAISTKARKPNSQWGGRSSRVRSFSSLLSVFKKLKDFAFKASKIKWVSSFYGLSKLESFPTKFEGRFMENGALGMALMSVTSTARVKISPFVATLAANPTFISGLFAWVIAQSIKVLLNFWVERKWDLRIMFACGGMPSSHSALCTALTTSVAICHGVADSLFPVCLGFSLIVMYDAIGVRRHAGMQAEVLNVIVEDLFQGHPISQRKLKELLGHTPSQVIAGALLGILVAWFCCQAFASTT